MIDLQIKIPEKEYAAILRGEVKMSALKNWSVFDAIRNGTLLHDEKVENHYEIRDRD